MSQATETASTTASTQDVSGQGRPAVTATIRKRDGREMTFEPRLIERAIGAAFRDVYGVGAGEDMGQALSARVRDITGKVETLVQRDWERSGTPVDVEHIQDLVETELMSAGEFKAAKGYILYRENRKPRAPATRRAGPRAKAHPCGRSRRHPPPGGHPSGQAPHL